MNRRLSHWLNGSAAAVALLASIGAATLTEGRVQPNRIVTADTRDPVAASPPKTLVDASGQRITVKDYRRIASGSLVADQLLLDLAEPDRILALTSYGARTSPRRYRYAGKLRLESLDDMEAILALKADLVLINNYSDAGRIARLREAGIEVFDLGETRGLATLLPNVIAIATLLGDPSRGAAYSETLKDRLARVAASRARGSRCSALYASVYGDRIFGGTVGTSYHDVLTYAGLVDVARERFRNWPHYTAEELLGLDPEIVVTKPGMGQLLCRQPGLERLGVCGNAARVVEIPGALLDDPGPTMLEAAELLFKRVYGNSRTHRSNRACTR